MKADSLVDLRAELMAALKVLKLADLSVAWKVEPKAEDLVE
jgi:hypothetical protein